jgi:hypothetical protein
LVRMAARLWAICSFIESLPILCSRLGDGGAGWLGFGLGVVGVFDRNLVAVGDGEGDLRDGASLGAGGRSDVADFCARNVTVRV